MATHVFKELLPAVIHALEVLPNSRDNAVVGMATAYRSSVSAPSFLLPGNPKHGTERHETVICQTADS